MPVQVPGVAVTRRPSAGVPVTAGAAVLTGGRPATGPISAEVLGPLPAAGGGDAHAHFEPTSAGVRT